MAMNCSFQIGQIFVFLFRQNPRCRGPGIVRAECARIHFVRLTSRLVAPIDRTEGTLAT